MTRRRWPAQLLPDDLGAVVSGPVLLARSPGIAVGLRCVFAHPTGLHLPLVLCAEGVQAEAAGRRTGGRDRPDDRGPEDTAPDPWSGLLLTVEVDGESRAADPVGQDTSSSADRYDLQANYWIGRLPVDGLLRLSVGWPAAGLTDNSTVLRLGDLTGLERRVVALR
jgi:hypothetical protein